jgi:DNA polymerase-3 subunit alpha
VLYFTQYISINLIYIVCCQSKIEVILAQHTNFKQTMFLRSHAQRMATELSPAPRQALIFDLETTGLPPAKLEDGTQNYAAFPYITQITILIYDLDSDKLLRYYNHYVKLPPGVEVPPRIQEITNITTELCNTYGADLLYVLQMFYEEYMKSEYIVAHNIDFDSKVIFAQYFRIDPNIISSIMPEWGRLFSAAAGGPKLYCTMKEGKSHLEEKYAAATGSQKSVKRPKLQELFYDLFSEDFDTDLPCQLSWHNSFTDTIVCMRCFIMLHLKKDTKINIYDLPA